MLFRRRGSSFKNHEEEEDSESKWAILSATSSSLKTATTRIKYGMFLLFSFFIGLSIKDAAKFLQNLPFVSTTICDGNCDANILILRLSLSLSAFYLLFAVLSSPLCCLVSPSIRNWFQRSFFLLKTILFGVLLVLPYIFVSDSVIASYGVISAFASAFYIFIQIVVLIDFAYSWNEKWASYDQTKYYAALLCFSGIFIVIGLVLNFMMMYWYTGSGCFMNVVVIALTLVSATAYTILSIFVEHGNLLASSIVFCYSSFLAYGAIHSEPSDYKCISVGTHSNAPFWQLLGGVLFGGLSMLYTAMTLGDDTSKVFELGDSNSHEPASSSLWTTITCGLFSGSSGNQNANESKSFFWFHTFMILATAHMAMLLTGWQLSYSDSPVATAQDASPGTTAFLSYDKGWTSFYSKLGSEMAMIVVYVWSLVAPYVCSRIRQEDDAFDD